MNVFFAAMLALAVGAGVLAKPNSAFGDSIADGEKLFNTTCVKCHAIEPGLNRVGPTLQGVVGRRSASVPGYKYSSAMKLSHITWSEDQLKKYLIGPQAMIRCHEHMTRFVQQCDGIRMGFPGFRDAKDADAVISYLKTK